MDEGQERQERQDNSDSLRLVLPPGSSVAELTAGGDASRASLRLCESLGSLEPVETDLAFLVAVGEAGDPDLVIEAVTLPGGRRFEITGEYRKRLHELATWTDYNPGNRISHIFDQVMRPLIERKDGTLALYHDDPAFHERTQRLQRRAAGGADMADIVVRSGAAEPFQFHLKAGDVIEVAIEGWEERDAPGTVLISFVGDKDPSTLPPGRREEADASAPSHRFTVPHADLWTISLLGDGREVLRYHVAILNGAD